ncbi:MAG: hypothetical protein WBP45_09375, partial [Daejeonella sp.]
ACGWKLRSVLIVLSCVCFFKAFVVFGIGYFFIKENCEAIMNTNKKQTEVNNVTCPRGIERIVVKAN